jgi:hypothetical protein
MAKRFILFSVLLFATNASASSMKDFYWPDFYLGADAQVREIRLKPNYGGNFYKSRDYPQANVYFGIMGNEYIGIEAGYEASRGRTHTICVPKGAILFGKVHPVDGRYKTVARFRGFHSNVIGFLPIFDDKRFKLLASVGFTNFQAKLENILIHTGNRAVNAAGRGYLSQSKIVLRLMTGVQYMCSDAFGLRANVSWENTAQLSNIEPIRANISTIKAKARDSFMYGLGIFVKF